MALAKGPACFRRKLISNVTSLLMPPTTAMGNTLIAVTRYWHTDLSGEILTFYGYGRYWHTDPSWWHTDLSLVMTVTLTRYWHTDPILTWYWHTDPILTYSSFTLKSTTHLSRPPPSLKSEIFSWLKSTTHISRPKRQNKRPKGAKNTKKQVFNQRFQCFKKWFLFTA